MKEIIYLNTINTEDDVVLSRKVARDISSLAGLGSQDQSRVATAVSEITRNALKYAGKAEITFYIEGKYPDNLLYSKVTDKGAGIADINKILEGRSLKPKSVSGILIAKKLMDFFDVSTSKGRGTEIILGKRLPRFISFQEVSAISSQVKNTFLKSPYEELQSQNKELNYILEELNKSNERIMEINKELVETNKGIVALYTQLDEKTEQLQSALESRSRFFAYMSHEFRTPANSIIGLARLLMNKTDGDLNQEQEKQVNFILKSANNLLEIINDFLDIRKAEEGKATVNPNKFKADAFFITLRGLLKPLNSNKNIAMIFQESENIHEIYNDENKIYQIIRNLVSNALKFMLKGTVKISIHYNAKKEMLEFIVSDTGIGIAPENIEKIFDEYYRVEDPSTIKAEGTGLGLPLSLSLAKMLGGNITVKSRLNEGSSFCLTVPITFRTPEQIEKRKNKIPHEKNLHILITEDNKATQFLYSKFLSGTEFTPFFAESIQQAKQFIEKTRPFAVILDIILRDGEAWGLIADLKNNIATRDIPVFVVSILQEKEKGLLIGADDYMVKPIDKQFLLNKLRTISIDTKLKKILIIDDDIMSRYLIKSFLSLMPCRILEAGDGEEGLEKAFSEMPDLIMLDLVMPKKDGFSVLKELRQNEKTRHIKVIILTAKVLTSAEKKELSMQANELLRKEDIGPGVLIPKVINSISKLKDNN